MGIIKYKPTSPGRRFQSVSDFAEITSTEPVKSLLKPIEENRWPQQLWPDHGALHWWRSQTKISDD